MVSPYDKTTSRRAPLVRVEAAKALIVEGSIAGSGLFVRRRERFSGFDRGKRIGG